MNSRRDTGSATVRLLAMGILVMGMLGGCASAADRGLPNDLPTSIQVVDGTVSNAVKGGDKNWSFSVTVAGAEDQKAAVAKLKDEGYSEIGRSTHDETVTVALSNTKTRINATLLLTKRDGKHLVIYNLIKV